MVYFGERRFRQTRSGPAAAEMLKILIPILVLGGLILYIVAQSGLFRSPTTHEVFLPPEREGVTQVDPLAPRADAEGDAASGDPDGQPRAGGVIDSPPLPPHAEPEPFSPNDPILSDVRDGRLDDQGKIVDEELPSEDAAITYLFHRHRAGFPVPVEDPLPEYPDGYRGRTDELRGRRFTFDLVLQEEPIFLTLEENPSGVEYYYDAIGVDDSQFFHRVVFAERDAYYGVGAQIRVTADFLRLHMYENRMGQAVMIPTWVAYDVTASPEPPPVDLSHWNPVAWAAGIGGLGLVILWVTMVVQGGLRRTPARHYSRHRRRENRLDVANAAGSNDLDPGDTAEKPEDAQPSDS